MPVYQIDTDKGTFEIDADREPTSEEAQQAIQNLSAAKPSPIAEQEAFKKKFIQEGTQTPINQALSSLLSPYKFAGNAVTGLVETGVKGFQGLNKMAGRALSQPTTAEQAKTLLGDLGQTTTEIVPRLAYELAGQGGTKFLQNPSEAIASLNPVVNPLQDAILSLLAPRPSPTASQAQKEFENQIVNQALAEQGKQPIVAFAQKQAGLPPAGEANIDVARAAPLLLGAESLPSLATSLGKAVAAPFTKAISRTLPATIEQSAMAALDMTAPEVAQHIPVVTQRVGELFGKKIPQTAEEALAQVKTAESSLYKDALSVDKQAATQGLAPRGDLILQKVQETLDSIPNLLPKERTALLKDATERYGKVSSTSEGRAMHQRLNKEFESQFDNGTFDRAAPANEVKLAVRNAIAEQMDEINKAVTGIDSSPYSDIGSLIEFKGNLTKNLQGIQKAEAVQKTGLGGSKGKANVPLTKFQAVSQAKKSLLTPFQKTQLEKLNQNVSKIFKEGERAGEAQALAPEVQQVLLEKYGVQELAPPSSSQVIAFPTIEQQLQAALEQAKSAFPNATPEIQQQIADQLIQQAAPKKPRALMGETINR